MTMQAPKPYREQRPWGEFVEFTLNTPSTVKMLIVKAGEAFSLQSHEKREEFWHIISGDGTVTIGTRESAIVPGGEYFIPENTLHRIQAGTSSVVVLEISFGRFDEKDVVRIQDKYGRTS